MTALVPLRPLAWAGPVRRGGAPSGLVRPWVVSSLQRLESYMRVATDQREMADDRQPAPQPPPRLGGTDLFRGAMVILAAVIIGGLVLSRGIDGDDTAPGADTDTEQADVDPASGAVTDTDTDPAGGDAMADPAADADAGTDPATGAESDPGTDPGATPTVPADDSATTGEDTGATTETTTSPLDTVRAPAEVRTLVLNAGGPQGIAGRATELLQAASYLTSAAKNADVNGPSAIYYAEGFQAEALAVASVFGPDLETLVQPLDTANPPSADLQQATVILVVGADDLIAVP